MAVGKIGQKVQTGRRSDIENRQGQQCQRKIETIVTRQLCQISAVRFEEKKKACFPFSLYQAGYKRRCVLVA